MKGPRPVPTQLNKIRGNPGKRAVNKQEPKSVPVSADVPPPEHLGEIASDTWKQMVAMLAGSRVITELDLMALELYVTAYQTYREAHMKLAEEGPIVVSPRSGYPVQSPHLGIANVAHGQMVKLAAEFGLTPSSRSRITTVKDPEPDNPFMSLKH